MGGAQLLARDSKRWRSLYRLGAAAAAVMLALIPVQAMVFFVAPPPTGAAGWFALFEKSALLALLSLDLLYMVDIVLVGLLLTVLCVALRRAPAALLVTVLFLNVVATAMYFASNPAFELLTLSRGYAAAATEAQRATFLGAAEAMIATYTGSAYVVSYELAGLAGLLLAVAMLKTRVFGKVTGWLGVAMNLLALVPPTVGAVGMAAALLFLPPFMVWLVLVIRRLLQLSRPEQASPRLSALLARHATA